jgi:hypothetical protein
MLSPLQAKIFLAALLISTNAGLICGQPRQVAPHKGDGTTVPFVGCASDGQVGPLGRPKGETKLVLVAASLASRLSYYKAEEGPGVLGPRGWHCFGTYGSSGSNLYLSPEPINSKNIFSDSWKGFVGPAIQASISIGDTSGRFEVAETIAKVFPAHESFADRVIAEGIEPASAFPKGPYPHDKLTYLSREMVEYQTPANLEGLGTRSYLVKNGSPIYGAAILDPDMDLTFLAVRLPSVMNDLSDAIIRQAERESAKTTEQRNQ